MADLSQLVKSLNIELVTKAKGHKRRAWLTSDIAEVQPSINPDNFGTHSPHVEDTSSAITPVTTADNIASLKNTHCEAHNDNGLQIDHKQVTNRLQNRSQIDDATENRSQIGYTTDHTIDHKQVTNGLQIDHKQVTNGSFIDTSTNLKVALSRIQGQEKELLLFMFWSTKKTRSRFTESLSLEYIKYSTDINEKSIKTVIHRLVNEKNIVSRHESKKGRGGWTIYQIREDVYNQLLMEEAQREQRTNGLQIDHKQVTNGLQTDHKWIAKEVTQQITEPLSSSINNINNKTTTEPMNKSAFFDHDSFLQSIHETLELLKNENVHFERYHIGQMLNNAGAEPQMIADSLDAFLFDIVSNDKLKKIKTSPVNYFMGIMRNTNHYTPPKEYKSKKQRYLDDMKFILENEIKTENELKEMMFNKWIEELKEEEKINIIDKNKTDVEATTIANKSVPAHAITMTIQSILKRYFNQNVFHSMEYMYRQKLSLPTD